MKKIIAAALAFGLMSAANVYAGSASMQINAPSSVQAGETFDVEIDLTENSGFTSMDMVVEYDPSVVKAKGAGSAASDTICFTDGNNIKQMFITESLINTMTNIKPESGDANYGGKSNGSLTAAELGSIRLSAFVTAADENMMLKKIYDTGTICTLKFEAVGSGSTDIKVNGVKFATIDPGESWYADASANVSVSGSSAVQTEAQTKAATARTSSGGGSGSEKTTKAAETTTAAQTKEETTEAATEATTESVTAAPAKTSFNDISNYAWAVNYINDLAAKGVINGYSDGSFKPGNNVKRCDFVVMLARALNLVNNDEENFSDVSPNAYYADAVAAARAAGIVNGNGDGTFSPDSFITRQDMMIMAKGAAEYKGVSINSDQSVLAKFADNNAISAYAKDSVAAMVNAGIVNGTGNNIEPKGNTTRAQAAVIISKILEVID
ncbi:MAG: S-layer homology domain-containing protein [Firmicutes bacterium]|nr:S-layer homology domain-containing protein [Bacillota bacterium]